MQHIQFLMQIEELALEKNLRINMTRIPNACGFIFYFSDIEKKKSSKGLLYLPYKHDVEDLFKKLEKLANEFKEGSDNDHKRTPKKDR